MEKIQALWCEPDIIWYSDVALPNILKQLLFVSVLQDEGRLACQHLIDDAPDTPPVHSKSVALPINYLRSKVFRGPAQSEGVRVALYVFLGQSEVCQLRIAISVDQDILWLQIPVNDLVLVKMIYGQNDLGAVELSATDLIH